MVNVSRTIRSRQSLCWLCFAAFGIAGCASDSRQSYEECVVELGQTLEANDVVRLCREAFPEPPEPEPDLPFYAGEFFYPTTGSQCGTIGFRTGGLISPSATGYCGTSSRIECGTDRCWFTCRNYNQSDTAVVQIAAPNESGIELHRVPFDSTSTPSQQLWRRMAECEMAMRVAQRSPRGWYSEFLEGLNLPTPDRERLINRPSYLTLPRPDSLRR